MANQPGLTKLEHFAGLAMMGLLPNPDSGNIDVERLAIAYARALIAELNKEEAL